MKVGEESNSCTVKALTVKSTLRWRTGKACASPSSGRFHPHSAAISPIVFPQLSFSFLLPLPHSVLSRPLSYSLLLSPLLRSTLAFRSWFRGQFCREASAASLGCLCQSHVTSIPAAHWSLFYNCNWFFLKLPSECLRSGTGLSFSPFFFFSFFLTKPE